MSKGWTPERRLAQKQRARKLYEEGRFGGPGRGQGRKPKRRLDLSVSCPHCGGSLEGLRLDSGGGTVNKDELTASDSFVVLRDGTFVKLDDDDMGFDDVGFSDGSETLRWGQSVSVTGQRGSITGFSRDRDHVYVRFDRGGARKVPVDEVGSVR